MTEAVYNMIEVARYAETTHHKPMMIVGFTILSLLRASTHLDKFI